MVYLVGAGEETRVLGMKVFKRSLLLNMKVLSLEEFQKISEMLYLNKSMVGRFCQNKSLVSLQQSLELSNWAFSNGVADSLGLKKLEF